MALHSLRVFPLSFLISPTGPDRFAGKADIDSRFVEYVGIETFVFLCKALLEGAEKLYELRYTVRTHRWTLFREVY